MKVLHLVWGMKTGGVETMLVNIINEQVNTEKVYLFIVNDYVSEELIKKIDKRCIIKRINRKPKTKNYLNIIWLNILLLTIWPDIIHVHSYRLSKLVIGNWKIVRTIHNTNNKPEEYPRMKALYAISDAVADFTRKQGFSNVKCIYNGIETRKFRQRLQIQSDEHIYKIVQVSRLFIKQKGQDLLIKALAKLLNKGVNNFGLYLIGEGKDEMLLKNMVRESGLENFVNFEGLKTQGYIYNHLCDYDLFVQPSRYEGFGITVAEAMSAKVPVLVSNIEGPMEIIGYGAYGMCFKTEDVEDLADKLENILKGGYDYTLIDKAYHQVCENYDVKQTAHRYLQEYRNVIII